MPKEEGLRGQEGRGDAERALAGGQVSHAASRRGGTASAKPRRPGCAWRVGAWRAQERTRTGGSEDREGTGEGMGRSFGTLGAVGRVHVTGRHQGCLSVDPAPS